MTTKRYRNQAVKHCFRYKICYTDSFYDDKCQEIYGAECVPVGPTYTCGCKDGYVSHGAFCHAEVTIDTHLLMSFNPMRTSWILSQAQCIIEGGSLAYFHPSQLPRLMMHIRNALTTIIEKDSIGSVWLGARTNKTGSLNWITSNRSVAGDSQSREHSGHLCLATSLRSKLEWYHCGDWKLPGLCEKTSEARESLKENSHLCDEGFMKNGSRCQDVNECALDIHQCSQFSNCVNTEGSYECQCKGGFFNDGKFECFQMLSSELRLFSSTSTADSCFEAEERCEWAGGRLASFDNDIARNLLNDYATSFSIKT